MDRVYPSKVDWWIAAMLVAGPLCAAGYGIYFVLKGWVMLALLLFIFAAIIGVTIWVLTIPCRYTLTAAALVIECGWLNDRIPYGDILDAVPSSNPLSAPALSLRRVKIVMRKGFGQLISPRDREGFISELKARIASSS